MTARQFCKTAKLGLFSHYLVESEVKSDIIGVTLNGFFYDSLQSNDIETDVEKSQTRP